jgi:hypothetical protein
MLVEEGGRLLLGFLRIFVTRALGASRLSPGPGHAAIVPRSRLGDGGVSLMTRRHWRNRLGTARFRGRATV